VLLKRKVILSLLLALTLVSGAVVVLIYQLFVDNYTELRYSYPIITKEGQDVTERVRQNFFWEWVPFFTLPITATLTFFITACVLLWRSHAAQSLTMLSSVQAGRDIETIDDTESRPEQNHAQKWPIGGA
jgi:hypothetical protein